MTHILNASDRQHGWVFTLDRPRAGVRVKTVDRDSVEVQDVIVLKGGAELIRLPDRIRVVGLDGKQIKPSKGKVFAITVETIEPYHIVTEVPL